MCICTCAHAIVSHVYVYILGLRNSAIVNHCYNSWSTIVTTVVLFTIVIVVDMSEWILQILGHVSCYQCLVYM